MLNQNLVLFSGYAKLPTGITAGELYKTIGLIVIVDVNTSEIIQADCTLATNLASQHVAGALIGCSFKNGPDGMCQMIERIYQGSAKKAIITAIRIIYDKYRNFMLEYENTIEET
ncbi:MULTISPECIES: DUF3870 domain-containing protein [Anaerosinus]|uniref:DUF3870 domain-containing protein n=1 Tax=Selenobaculum gibii TaxID=3054208 RepID=A0A9Y2AH55_9FIRM|nr:DUF3870 domain-containing protein [Selenobaculum gbiensis]WIW69681.1 DUF3870 domain-containing protein [Selenobaculum gbiensis]